MTHFDTSRWTRTGKGGIGHKHDGAQRYPASSGHGPVFGILDIAWAEIKVALFIDMYAFILISQG